MASHYSSASEMCSLFLNNSYRKSGLGSSLSKIRSLYLKLFPDRFANIIIADIRGVIDRAGESPFWNSLGKKFLDMPYSQAIEIIPLQNYTPISDILPTAPIYFNFLPRRVIKIIGKPHTNTKPAYNMLLNQGFAYNNHVNIFDAGPIIECEKNKIVANSEAKKYSVSRISEKNISRERRLITNDKLDFRGTIGKVDIINDREAALSEEILDILQINPGEKILVL
ncbi:MAG: arginine N-succinyltransferase [Legionellales bacterium]|nr:arginine N-succinyltransferase [Legionellales bacterium]